MFLVLVYPPTLPGQTFVSFNPTDGKLKTLVEKKKKEEEEEPTQHMRHSFKGGATLTLFKMSYNCAGVFDSFTLLPAFKLPSLSRGYFWRYFFSKSLLWPTAE